MRDNRESIRICVFLPNWLGDVIMATPALRAIRRHFGPHARIVGVMRPKLAGLLAGTAWLDEEWYFDPRARQSEMRSLPLLEGLRRERFDLAVLFPNALRAALLAWLGGTQERVGYVRNGRGPLLTGKVYPKRENGRILPKPMVNYYLRIAEALGCGPESPRLELGHTAEEDPLADQIWQELGLRRDGRVIALNRSGAYGSSKLWPVEHSAQLAQRVVDQMDHDVLLVCGPGEHAAAKEIARRAQRPRVFVMPQQSLGLTASKACIRRSRLLVTTDSGPRHIAAALDVPVLTLLGPTRSIWIENPQVRGRDLQLDLGCIGCGQRLCPLGHHRCMEDLSVDLVYRGVVNLLEECTKRAA
jgi:heptosyltransferase-2